MVPCLARVWLEVGAFGYDSGSLYGRKKMAAHPCIVLPPELSSPAFDLRAHSGGWRCAEGNLPGHKHAGAIDSVHLAATASRVRTKVYVRKTISDSRPVRRHD